MLSQKDKEENQLSTTVTCFMLKHDVFFIIMIVRIFIEEGLKWLVTILAIVLAHIPHVHVTANAVNVLHITAEAAKYQDASFPNPEKRLTTGPLKISTEITKRIINQITKPCSTTWFFHFQA